MISAASLGKVSDVIELLKKGADVNSMDTNGWAALMLAAVYGHTVCASILLKRGADVNRIDYEGNKALLLAAWHGRN